MGCNKFFSKDIQLQRFWAVMGRWWAGGGPVEFGLNFLKILINKLFQFFL